MKHSVARLLVVVTALTAITVSARDYSSPQPAQSVAVPMQDVHPLALRDAPQPVQQSIRNRGSNAIVREVDQANWNGQTVYSVVIDNHGRFNQYIFDQKGKVLSEPARPISEAAGAQPNHSNQTNTDAQHDHQIPQRPR